MAQLIRGLEVERVAGNLREVRERIAASAGGREVVLVVATKYVHPDEVGVLARAGVEVVGENRLQDLVAKQEEHREAFAWEFIGRLQSRKVREVAGRVRRIHSLATDSSLRALARVENPPEVLVEVNVAGEAGKEGVAPGELAAFLERARGCAPVSGLTTMPPQAPDAEHSRRHFAALRELAEAHGLRELSMGTTQDFEVAVQEGASIVRVGSRLFA